MRKLAQGESAVLNVTQEARHRVFVGLGWDPAENISLIDRAKAMAGGKKIHHDLDLACYIFDRDGRYISHVSADSAHAADQTGQIYHSGDNVEGLGDGDDEQISVELKDLDPVISNIIFKASIKSGHSFKEVRDPEIHISDGYTGHSFLHQPLSGVAGNDKNAFVFIRLYKTPENQWKIQNIAQFLDQAETTEWSEILKPYTRL